MAKRLLILHTGGTISMKEGENGKVSPSARNPLLDALERLNHPAELHQESGLMCLLHTSRSITGLY